MTWPGWERFGENVIQDGPGCPRTGKREAGKMAGHKDRTSPPGAAGGRNKYRAQPIMVEGVRFASKREARRWQALVALERAGQIRDLERQVRIPLHAAGGGLVGHYVADFRYVDLGLGVSVIEDAKGMRLPLYAWKARHIKAEYGWTIREV